VLTLLGAEVDAVDVDPGLVEIARRNALSYVGAQARFHYVGDTRRLDWPNETFDFVCCNSVLEYVDPGHLPGVLADLDRVLKPGGRIYIIGTSNRLWPVEVHSRGVLTNYLPQSLARRIRPPRGVQQGTFYWSMRRHLRGYRNLDAVERNRPYLRAKRRTMDRSWRYYVLVAAAWVLGRLGIAAGTLTPSINAVLEKPRQAAR
jgi:SAM-dependent methyltransferase